MPGPPPPRHRPTSDRLTARQLEVVGLLMGGRRNYEIASLLALEGGEAYISRVIAAAVRRTGAANKLDLIASVAAEFCTPV